MISRDDAIAYLDEMFGITAPNFVLDAAIIDVGALESDMTAAGYAASTIVRIQAMAVALVAGADFARRVASQAAPSGSSRSFKNDEKAMAALRRQLTTLDPAGITDAVVGPDPTTNALVLVV